MSGSSAVDRARRLVHTQDEHLILVNELLPTPFRLEVPDARLLVVPTEAELLAQEALGLDIAAFPPGRPRSVARLRRGAVLFCIVVGRQVAHVSWAALTRRAGRDFYSFPLPASGASIGGTLTAEPFRRRGLNLAMHEVIFSWLRAHGARRAFLAIRRGNAAALESQRKLGSTVSGIGRYDRYLYVIRIHRLLPVTDG